MNFLVNALAEKGIIKLKRFKRSKNKKGYLYLLTAEGVRKKVEMSKKFLIEKTHEYKKIKKDIESLRREIEV